MYGTHISMAAIKFSVLRSTMEGRRLCKEVDGVRNIEDWSRGIMGISLGVTKHTL